MYGLSVRLWMPLILNEELSVWFPPRNKKAVFEMKYLSELTAYSSRVRQGSLGQVALRGCVGLT